MEQGIDSRLRHSNHPVRDHVVTKERNTIIQKTEKTGYSFQLISTNT